MPALSVDFQSRHAAEMNWVSRFLEATPVPTTADTIRQFVGQGAAFVVDENGRFRDG